MRQSGAEALVTEEPYAFIAHVRVWGGRVGKHRLYPEADAQQSPLVPRSACWARLTASVRLQYRVHIFRMVAWSPMSKGQKCSSIDIFFSHLNSDILLCMLHHRGKSMKKDTMRG